MVKSTRPFTGPLARDTKLTVEQLSSETVIYDHRRHRVHCLNHTVAFIFEQCDGHTTIQEIADRLPGALNLPSDPDIVLVALRKLNRIHLLGGELSGLDSTELPSRRELVQRFAALGATATALLPVVTSIVAPTPAMAASGDGHTQPGNGNGNGNGQGNGNGNGQGEQGDNGHGHQNS
ncbi:MAG TPA: PqqD family protein [Bryobacteraceae bacterium]|nr:PqqD family protein [Bryobacteraceae bacterium]